MMAMQMGLGFASMVDPVNGVNVAVLSQFYLMLVTLLFLAMNGHIVAIEVMVESFRTMPVALMSFDVELLWKLVNWSVWMVASAVLVALACGDGDTDCEFCFWHYEPSSTSTKCIFSGLSLYHGVWFIHCVHQFDGLLASVPAHCRSGHDTA